tara:strand:- start:752 stop:1282 length:531 start_codon:yes stop_codon:yes gene_type:complete
MKTRWFILCLISILFMGCGALKPFTNPVKDMSSPIRPLPAPNPEGGQGEFFIHPETKQPFDGVYDVVENGERLKMDIKAGWKTGLYRRWYPNSKQLKSEWNLLKSQRHGLQRDWYPNGQLRLEASFQKGICINAKTWTISGTLASEVIRGNGSLVLFKQDGSINRESIYKAGRKVN